MTKSSSTESFPNTCLSCVIVPPYKADDATTWSPGCNIVNNAADCAASPLAKATAPAPPSRFAMRSSNAATVGFMIRE